jgi:hypothetical protein
MLKVTYMSEARTGLNTLAFDPCLLLTKHAHNIIFKLSDVSLFKVKKRTKWVWM